MTFLTFFYGRSFRLSASFVLWAVLTSASFLQAQTETNAGLPSPGQISVDFTNAPSSSITVDPNVPAATPVAPPAPAATPSLTEDHSMLTTEVISVIPSAGILAALMTLASLGGFLLYQSGLTRAKNCGHTATLLLVGVLFALTGYWIGGFAVQMGGVGAEHAALAQPIPPVLKSALDHELGYHHWGFMGSSGFFLMTDSGSTNAIAALFLGQAALLAIAVAAALGAALERSRIVAMAVCSFLIGVFIYPLLANWAWGGGWLASLGSEYDLGNGFVDLGGAGIIHETAGVLALVLALTIGPRYGRFGRNKSSTPIPGHNVPFLLLGSVVLLLSWMATNAFASASPSVRETGSSAELAAVNTLLAAMGGLLVSFFLAAWRKRRPDPAALGRGLLGGAVASCGCAALIDPWAAFVIGVVAGLLVQGAMTFLEKRRIDDPVGAAATHGMGGAWGVLATGLFANGTAGKGLNGVDETARGLFFGGAWHQLVAQVIGCATIFAVVFILGYAILTLIQKIVGLRVELVDETGGLDWPQIGALGYQGDPEESVGDK